MCSEPSTTTMYLLGTEDVKGEQPHTLYNLHIVEGYDLAGACRDYNRIYKLNYETEQVVLVRIVDQYRSAGPLIGTGLKYKSNRQHDEEDTDEVNMKEAIVKGNRTKEKKPLDVIEYVSQFNLASELELWMPYLLEITDTDDGSFERRVILVDSIGNDHIDYRYWTEDGEYKTSTLLPHFFQEGTCKLYKITAEDLK